MYELEKDGRGKYAEERTEWIKIKKIRRRRKKKNINKKRVRLVVKTILRSKRQYWPLVVHTNRLRILHVKKKNIDIV